MGKSLVTTTEYKAYAGINSSNQDVQIAAIIPKVSQLVKTLCRRTFVDFVDEAKTDKFSFGLLNLTEYPVIAVDSVELSSDNGATYTALVEFTDYVLDTETEQILPLNEYYTPNGFTKRVNGYRVSYTAGYEQLPVDLKLAVLDLVTYYIKNDGAVHSPKAPGTNTVQIEYITKNTLPAHIARILDQYTANYL